MGDEARTHALLPKTRRKSSSTAVGGDASSRPEPTIIKRRNLSFASTTSPWFRRNLFLSPSMIQSENFSVYESHSYYPESASYNIISLKECQGFVFNQDLFASPYQQLRLLANEKRYRALSFLSHHSPRQRYVYRPKSGASSGLESCGGSPDPAEQRRRRHTSHMEPRPSFFGSPAADNGESSSSGDAEKSPIVPSLAEVDKLHGNDEAIVDEYDEDELDDYGGANRMYKVHVAEIVVNEDDSSLYPTGLR